MRARDLGVSVVAVAAAFIALQGTPDISVQLRWVVGVGSRPRGYTLPVPLPLVTDLDGDGKNEVVVLADGGMTIRVLSIPIASGETLTDPVLLYEAKLAPKSKLPGERRAVAMAAGYLEASPPPLPGNAATSDTTQQQKGRRRQHVVVVREDWSVICFDHELVKVWKEPLEHAGSPAEGSSFLIDQVAIAVTHATLKAKKIATEGYPVDVGVGGLVVVGASMRHKDGRHHHSRAESHGPSGGAPGGTDPLGVHVEAFVEGEEDSRDEAEEAKIRAEENEMRAAEHFSLFGLDGATGAVRWKHVRIERDETPARPEVDTAPRSSQHGLAELEHLLNGVDFFTDNENSNANGKPLEKYAFHGLEKTRGGGRRYHRSLIHMLPHAWSSPVDTRLEVTSFRRSGAGSRSTEGGGEMGVGGATPIGGGGGIYSPASGAQKVPPAGGGSGGVEGGGDGGGEGGRGGGVVKVVVARTREGLEAVELSTGRPLGAVALPAAVSGAGVYADLNGDGVVDRVQAVGVRGALGWGHLHAGVAMGHLSEQASPSEAQQARNLPPCYALAVSGLPPREQLFNGSICHDGGALLEIQERLSKRKSRSSSLALDVEVAASSPAVLAKGVPSSAVARPTGAGKAGTDSVDRGRGRGAGRGGGGGGGGGVRSDVVFAVSNGVVSSYNDHGRLNWQDRRGPTWERKDGPEVGQEIGGYVLPFTMEAAPAALGGGRNRDVSSHTEERILVVGQDKMIVYDRNGRLAGSTPLMAGPAQPPVIGDFDGDGIADVLIVGHGGTAAGYALAPDPGIRAMFVAVLVLVGAMLAVAAVYIPPPPSSSASALRRGSVGGGRGGGGGGGRAPPGVKSKRATD